VLAFTIGVAIATGLVFGILPARRAARAEASDLLRPAPGNAHARRGRLGRVLVGAELALATTLVIATGLLLKTVNSISRVDPGFDPGHLTTFQVAVPTALDDQAVQQFFDAFVQRIEALPGIEHAALASEVPLSDQHSDAFFRVDGVPLTDANDRPTANLRRVTADYFATLGVPLLRGRRFTAAEARGDAPVVAINEAMARRYVPGDPLGRRLLVERFPNERAYEIVALVRDIRHDALDAAPAPEMYIPTQTFWTPNVLIRSRLTPAAILATVRPELRRLDPTVPISEVTAYEDRVRHSFDAQRFRTELLIAFSLVAIALSAVGVYGLATYSVSQRTREIGVRLALGASTRTVLGGELTAALRLAAAGVGGGVVAAAALSQAMRALLFNVSATDPGTIGATAALLCGVTMVATFTAARRVARIDPLLALRAE
jgi:predicted permease